jgi:YidC/Oxa1 family membrane protein insertase
MLFWPLTAVSTRASKRMQTLQPQMKAIQEKYKDDPVKMNKKVMEFMKEHKVSPMSGCWPVLLQFPVLIGFFKMVQSAIELRGAAFLWACDLSKSDTVWVVPGLNFNVNPLPLLMGGTMLWQAQLMPPSPGMDPMQQKMMKYFPMVFLVVLYNYSAGLTLYWTVQNLLSIAQMKLTRAADEKKAVGPAAAPARTSAVLPPKKKK